MSLYPTRTSLPSSAVVHELILKSVAVADKAAKEGKHPFGCLLVGPDGDVLMEQGNIDTLNHAEMTLSRRACELWCRPGGVSKPVG